MFDARRSAYEGVLQLLRHRWSTVKAFRLEAGMEKGSAPEPFEPNELEALRTRLSLYAPDDVIASVDDFSRVLGKLAFAIGRLAAQRDFASDVSEAASEAGVQLADLSNAATEKSSQRETEVAEADREVDARFQALTRLMQEHLEGQSSSDG